MTNICEICNKENLPTVLDLGKHPLCDDLIRLGKKNKSKLYKIEITFCKDCIIAYQKHQVPKKKLFPKNYHYRSKFTKDVILGMKEIFNQSKKLCRNLKKKIVLDIGCNDGSLLDFFKREKSITIGIEPTNAADEARKKGHIIYKNYFDKNTVKKIKKKFKKIDIITFTNVFAHIENLKGLINNLQKIISKNTILIIENHYLGSVIKKNQFDTFYHEHPRTYSLQSFIKISKLLNLNIIYFSFPKRYGGNIRVILSKKKLKSKKFNNYLKYEKNYFLKLKNMKNKINKWKLIKRKVIDDLVNKHGPLPAKGFPGRAAILIKLLELNEKHLSKVYEQEKSIKVGNYVPGTRIPIVSDKKLAYLNPKIPLINLAWHISSEIKNYLKIKKIKNRVIQILNNKDFV